ncbi:MAG: Nicotinamide-nucleotide amidohydrolase PncC [Chlamydiia bacterium]|nr:Nicotinamide-nucleotide amidohydrolase PncC [Chlamydiia bacterium]
MKLAIASIGNELLQGRILNTNSQVIAKKLQEVGLGVDLTVEVADTSLGIASIFESHCSTFDVIICTGGLGPTHDDCTKKEVANFFKIPLKLDEEEKEKLDVRYEGKLLSCENQAMVPEGAIPLPNPVGTAPGLQLEVGGQLILLLPGVPQEMETIFEDSVLPYLVKRFTPQRKKEVDQITLLQVWEDKIVPLLDAVQKEFPKIELGSYPERSCVKVIAHGADQTCMDEIAIRFDTAFPHRVVRGVHESLAHIVQATFIQNGLTLAVAESITGGNIAARLTAIADSSLYFLGSFIVYSNALKQSILGVKESTLAQYGAVSEETAREMLAGVLEASDADYALATTGIAGPSGGSDKKPVGTVYLGIQRRGKEPKIFLLPKIFYPKRDIITEKSVSELLSSLLIDMREDGIQIP